jgi:adenosine deaminase/adenosine deaminase CECR1
MLRHYLLIVFLCIAYLNTQSISWSNPVNEARTAAAFDTMKNAPLERRIFLQQMPKGGDLHNHLDGAVYAESLIRWASEDGLCFKKNPPSLAPPPCDESKGLFAISSFDDKTEFYDALVNGLSMRNVSLSGKSGHDQFFSTFPRFGGILPEKRQADMIAEVVSRLARQNTFYVELMMTPSTLFGAGALGSALEWNENLAGMNEGLDQKKLAELARQTKNFVDETERRKSELLRCGQPNADAGCKVIVRYEAQVIRTFPRSHVFGQIALAALLAKSDPRFVTINLVNWEDHPIPARDYENQMRMVGFFTNKGKEVKVTLHAGELAPGLVPPEELRNHIRLAIEEAGATRIGHGIDIAYEDNPEDLLKKMAREKIMVETNLTSNDVILGVKDRDHPFLLYRKYNVPLTLSTDDEGVSRIDLTHEYQRAAETYDLGYTDLKALARNALEYSFLQGKSLWQSPGQYISDCANDAPEVIKPSQTCADFLSKNEKAQQQWKLEADFQKFETHDWSK